MTTGTVQHPIGTPAITLVTRQRLIEMSEHMANTENPKTIAAIMRVELRRLTYEYRLKEKQVFPS